MPSCNGRSCTLQSPKTGSPGRAGCDLRCDLSHCVPWVCAEVSFHLGLLEKRKLLEDRHYEEGVFWRWRQKQGKQTVHLPINNAIFHLWAHASPIF